MLVQGWSLRWQPDDICVHFGNCGASHARRKGKKLTQSQFARLVKSSQSRIAKMEKGDPSVSVDLLVKSLLIMGANKESIAKAIA